jgi:hypothetical protein
VNRLAVVVSRRGSDGPRTEFLDHLWVALLVETPAVPSDADALGSEARAMRLAASAAIKS